MYYRSLDINKFARIELPDKIIHVNIIAKEISTKPLPQGEIMNNNTCCKLKNNNTKYAMVSKCQRDCFFTSSKITDSLE